MKKIKYILFFIIILFSFYKCYEIIPKNNTFTYSKIDRQHSEKIGKLLVQDRKGRIKPINTLALELLRKIYKKDHIGKMDANQWIISILENPTIWVKIPFIKVDFKSKEENNFIKTVKANKYGYTSLNNLYVLKTDKKNKKYKEYVLKKDYEQAFSKIPSKRKNYDNAVLNISERVLILLGIINGEYLNIFPIPNDSKKIWTHWKGIKKNNNVINLINSYLISLYRSKKKNKWILADNDLKKIRNYQYFYGKNIILSNLKIKSEILYNSLNIFYYIMILYSIYGISLLILSFFKIFILKKKKIFICKILSNIIIFFVFLTFIYHSLGLCLRYYISSHPPWTNGYESVIFISWCIILSGFILLKYKNLFVSSITNLCSSILLMVAHSSLMNPQITNLVPVLKSYWLMIHVAIITSSYGFLFTGSFLGFIVLILYIVNFYFYRKKNNKNIKELTIINEISITIGIVLLTIGTLLGAIWANESWGSYWSWDPKETWALISIIIYAFVLHMRLFSGMKGHFYFNLASFLSISSIIITYFGVNYYLSGLHSYAKGDPVLLQNWFYFILIFIFLIICISFFSYKKNSNFC